jgi:hypothetical protein
MGRDPQGADDDDDVIVWGEVLKVRTTTTCKCGRFQRFSHTRPLVLHTSAPTHASLLQVANKRNMMFLFDASYLVRAGVCVPACVCVCVCVCVCACVLRGANRCERVFGLIQRSRAGALSPLCARPCRCRHTSKLGRVDEVWGRWIKGGRPLTPSAHVLAAVSLPSHATDIWGGGAPYLPAHIRPHRFNHPKHPNRFNQPNHPNRPTASTSRGLSAATSGQTPLPYACLPRRRFLRPVSLHSG